MCMWIEEFAKTKTQGPVGWVQGMKEVYIYVYVDRRVR